MYRYCVDNAVTYSPEDIVLFRESPFASWMERLTLENPDHGIAPDADAPAPPGTDTRQDALVEVLRAEKKHVEVIDSEADEPQRRTATLGAMRNGVDFIINGQLAVGPLSGAVNLLMRTSGYSELGNYLYLPCDTQAKTTLSSAFRLCFLADLLHSLQGQLPPQMLLIRSEADLLPLRTEDHIYHYQAVKRRFMRAMVEFRKHRMPDPAESVHFGRWSDCAHELMRQRALREEELPELVSEADLETQAETEAAAEPVAASPQQEVPALNSLGANFARIATAYGNSPAAARPAADYLDRLNFIGSEGPRPAVPAGKTRSAHPLDSRDYAAPPPRREPAEQSPVPGPRLQTGASPSAEATPAPTPTPRPFSSSLMTGPGSDEEEPGQG